MARPKKIGLDYFPFDVDFFEDEKIVAISGEFGIKGELAVIKLLCAIYRNGYFIEWSEMLQMKMLHSLKGVSLELLKTIVLRLVRWGFFDKTIFDSTSILTSVGIQKRYFEAISRRKNDYDYPYLLIDFPVKSSLCQQKPPFNNDLCQQKPHKEKESKEEENNIKEKNKWDDIKEGMLNDEIWGESVRKNNSLSSDDFIKVIDILIAYASTHTPEIGKADCKRLISKAVMKYKSLPKGSLEERMSRLEQEMRDANKNNILTKKELQEFWYYWTQTDASGSKMLYETHQYWDTTKRMELWKLHKQV